ncbi:DUF3224 domain-containing protein [Nocardia cyriacigeorgica]|uniref:DUF3224 domain-containing protein n=1 Tax=Nocardia cyriacigeorgica TaxID=135487 RepID=A0A6P1D8A9_9NOCA|nr:DUF3224 domain-containing protein [Nocardia cyriacigeorgica]NEW41457.1 DUF3224 domain-containing protein [Nocardia cyriacigeorgica]NEW45771.1 DUF3224 domain-containing protein [Nocardia cyriacigeorgica]NEW51969.1 DUF3224 domain-containing protein [Nocardia cyriacigeorgica]NEW55762.1 DUF3224 domain-containing protein [Nocardia cyriacigeorgica]
MRANGTFSVKSFTPTDVSPEPAIATGAPVGLARMEKQFEGEVSGRAATLFTSAFDEERGAGTYIAMESFEGSMQGAAGTFCFAHSATTTGTDRSAEFFVIVAGSGTAALAGITGTGGIAVDPDGTHRIWFDYELG